ncbi:MAG TPA: ATP synthase subunit I [Acidimicrobiales bacterium]|nr:ATP synthase subunit I [Acidimicrobiales bacterium]
MTTSAATMARLDPAAPVERQIAFDLIRRGLPVIPFLVGTAFLTSGTDGAASAAYAVALVLANFAVAAALLSWAARISLGTLMGVAMFGYLLRLAAITIAFFAVKDQPWMHPLAFGLTLIVTHLGLLIWELRFVSASLAFPGLKPRKD